MGRGPKRSRNGRYVDSTRYKKKRYMNKNAAKARAGRWAAHYTEPALADPVGSANNNAPVLLEAADDFQPIPGPSKGLCTNQSCVYHSPNSVRHPQRLRHQNMHCESSPGPSSSVTLLKQVCDLAASILQFTSTSKGSH